MEKQTAQTEEQRKDFRTTNKEFAKTQTFIDVCTRCFPLENIANVATVRQASKFRLKKGRVFKNK
jgi:hypothetical protein